MLRCGDSTIAATQAAHAAAEIYIIWRSAPGTPAACRARKSGEHALGAARSSACIPGCLTSFGARRMRGVRGLVALPGPAKVCCARQRRSVAPQLRREQRAPLQDQLTLQHSPARLAACQLLLRRLRRRVRAERGVSACGAERSWTARAKASVSGERAFNRAALLRSCARSAFSATSAMAAARPLRVSPTTASSASHTAVSFPRSTMVAVRGSVPSPHDNAATRSGNDKSVERSLS